MKLIPLASSASLVLAFVACGKDDKKSDPTPTPTATTAAVALPKSFETNCAGCHGKAGEGVSSFPALGPLAKGEFKVQTAFLAVIRSGTDKGMPKFTAEQISDDDLKTIHTYFSK